MARARAADAVVDDTLDEAAVDETRSRCSWRIAILMLNTRQQINHT